MHALKYFPNGDGQSHAPATGRFYFLQDRKYEWFWIFILLIMIKAYV